MFKVERVGSKVKLRIEIVASEMSWDVCFDIDVQNDFSACLLHDKMKKIILDRMSNQWQKGYDCRVEEVRSARRLRRACKAKGEAR